MMSKNFSADSDLLDFGPGDSRPRGRRRSGDADLLTWSVELLRIAKPEEAERLSTLSWDTLKREYGDKIVQLSDRRVGMRVGHCLMLSKG
jgi:hypothetical protein